MGKMLHNEARELLVQSYEETHNASEEKPDITINELKEKLALKASPQTIGRAVRAMGYRYKKKTVSATEKERPRCAGKTYRVARIRVVR